MRQQLVIGLWMIFALGIAASSDAQEMKVFVDDVGTASARLLV